jgi:hypothetical protein
MPESALRSFLLQRVVRGTIVPADADRDAVHAGRLRAGLMVGCAISIGIAGYLGDPSGYTHADPPLARLLRGMAVIKGVIAIAIVAAVWWRFGRAVSKPVAASYLLGSSVLAGSAMLIWQLSWILLAAILFHAAALSMLLVSWRER